MFWLVLYFLELLRLCQRLEGLRSLVVDLLVLGALKCGSLVVAKELLLVEFLVVLRLCESFEGLR